MNLMRIIAIICFLAALTVEAFGHERLRDSDEESMTDRVQAAAEALLAERFPEYAARLRVRVLRVHGSVADDARLRIRLTADDGVPKGRTHVRIAADPSAGAAGWAMLFVAHYDSVGVARRDLSSGERIAAGDVGTAWLDVTTFRGRPLDRATLERLRAGEQYFASQPIARGNVLRADDIRPPFAADTGETVTLTYRRGPIHLTVNCRAREPGVAGDVVRLYSDATRTTYKARLTGPGTAEWIATL